MNYNKALWGLVLILAGGVFILANLDIIQLYWSDMLRLWPVLFIFWGISLLPVKSGWKALLTFIVMLAAVGYVIQDDRGNRLWYYIEDDREELYYEDEDDYDRVMEFQREQIPFDSSITTAQLTFDGAAGVFEIERVSDEYLIDFQKKGNMGKYSIESSRSDSGYSIDIELNNATIGGKKNFNKADIMLHPYPVWNIMLDLGAADTRLDLREFKLSNLEINGGASNVEIKIGGKHPETTVEVDAGASNIMLYVPKESGAEVKFSSFLAGKDLEGFTRVSRRYYHTPDFENRDKRVTVKVEAAISSFTVKRF